MAFQEVHGWRLKTHDESQTETNIDSSVMVTLGGLLCLARDEALPNILILTGDDVG